MTAFRLDRLLELVTSQGFLLALLWLGVAALAVGLVRLLFTRWGQSQPLRKCLIWSVLAHLLLAGYAATVQIVDSAPSLPEAPPVRVSLDDPDATEPRAQATAATHQPRAPWLTLQSPTSVAPKPMPLARVDVPDNPAPQRQTAPSRSALDDLDAVERLPLAEAAQPEPDQLPNVGSLIFMRRAPLATSIAVPPPERREAPSPKIPHSPAVQRRQIGQLGLSDVMTRTQPQGLLATPLQQPIALPRLSSAESSPEPQAALPGTDYLGPIHAEQPAERVDLHAARGEPPASPASPMVQPQPATDHLQAPATALEGSMAEADTVLDGTPAEAATALAVPRLGVQPRRTHERPVPEPYRLRVAPNRAELAQQLGATPETEEAVQAALQWLANNQSADGRWDPRIHGAGQERLVLGRDRQGAGNQSDTGMTGLALLAFLAAGHTHQSGRHHDTVRKGIQFLLASQASDGSLGAQARIYEFMYCHGIATLALSEALGMTGDPQLVLPVRRAIAYTLAAQNPTTGGWRYRPKDPGDTSQFGWQLMALKSAELAGMPIASGTRQGAVRFLESVSSGRHGGLASYRPGEPVSVAMTAEALFCRQILGLSPEHPTAIEGADYLLQKLPGDGQANLYYWYYATMAMYPFQGARWQTWNAALQRALLATQRKDGPLAGSWDADSVWGGYGGRVYSTAMATLCLEVYYRFLPIYGHLPQATSR